MKRAEVESEEEPIEFLESKMSLLFISQNDSTWVFVLGYVQHARGRLPYGMK